MPPGCADNNLLLMGIENVACTFVYHMCHNNQLGYYGISHDDVILIC